MPGSAMWDAGTGVQTAMAILAAHVEKLSAGAASGSRSTQEAMTCYVRARAAARYYGNVGGLPVVDIHA